MVDDADIVTHSDPVGRSRTNYIERIELTTAGLPGRYEQLWTRVDASKHHELCCIPFFAYDVSLGDVLAIEDDGSYIVVEKGGHRTIRFIFPDVEDAHVHHEEIHGALAATGVLTEYRGHANSHGAVDLAIPQQAEEVIGILSPFQAVGMLVWEWGDPRVVD